MEHIIPVSRSQAEQVAASLARRYWPPDAAQLSWVTSAYRTDASRPTSRWNSVLP